MELRERLPDVDLTWDRLNDEALDSDFPWPVVQLVDATIDRPAPSVFIAAGRRIAEQCEVITSYTNPPRAVSQQLAPVVELPRPSLEERGRRIVEQYGQQEPEPQAPTYSGCLDFEHSLDLSREES